MADMLQIRYPATGVEAELAITDATIKAPDLRQFRIGEEPLATFDPGFMNTAVCRSSITYIDGEAGVLEYRGYPIAELAEKSTYLEVAYLLLHGELPNPTQLETWELSVTETRDEAEATDKHDDDPDQSSRGHHRAPVGTHPASLCRHVPQPWSVPKTSRNRAQWVSRCATQRDLLPLHERQAVTLQVTAPARSDPVGRQAQAGALLRYVPACSASSVMNSRRCIAAQNT